MDPIENVTFPHEVENLTVSTDTVGKSVQDKLLSDLPSQFDGFNISISDNSTQLKSILLQHQADLETKLESVLKEQNISVFNYFSKLSGIPSHTLPTTTTERIPYTSGVVSWGFITPITLIGIFLMFVAICLCYQNWKEKQRLRSYVPTGPVPIYSNEISASIKHDTGSRDSVRSNTSARSIGASTFDKSQIPPIPRKVPLKVGIEDHWKVLGPSRILSPIDENDTSNSKNTITELKPQRERFPSYQMSWLTESAKETYSPNWTEPKVIHAAENPNQLGNDEYYEDKPVMQQSEKSSQYFPHYNTPIDEFDVVSECSDNLRGGDSATSTHVNDNISLPSTIYPAAGRAPLSITDGADLSSIHTYFDNRPLSRRTEDYNIPSEHTSATTSFTESASGTLSLPSSISRFHASRLNNTPNSVYPLASTQNGSHAKLNFTVTSSVDMSENSQYTDNTSMFPNVGSSITSFGPSVTRSNPTSSCPSEISPEYYNGGTRSGTGPSTGQNSFSTSSGDGPPLHTTENSHVSLAREVEVFRNWSLSAGINSGSLGNLPVLAPTPLPSGESYNISQNKEDSGQSKSDGHITSNSYDLNHNLSPSDTRKVKFSVPVLNKKQYWV